MTDIFVFGSNLAGRHGKGAAKFALEHYGAVYGVGHGRTGNSYAIPTKDSHLRTLPIEAIRGWCFAFIEYARAHPELRFILTPIGCGLAGYTRDQIAPLLTGVPLNVEFHAEWFV